MKAIIYSVKPFEKRFLNEANQQKHELTFCEESLNPASARLASGNKAVIVFTNDTVSEEVVHLLHSAGITCILTRSAGTDHIDKAAAAKYGVKVSNVPSYSPQAIAEHAVALAFALNRHLISADRHAHHFDFRNDGLIGFNFFGKTVGIIGLGNTGLAASKIFHGMGCKIVGFDLLYPDEPSCIIPVTLDALLAQADIISLHLPLTTATRHIINMSTLNQMKPGVMLINTSRGALIHSEDLLKALQNGRIGYLGLDVYEFEKGLFFEDHENDLAHDSLLQALMAHRNVLITPHQAYLTKEALQEIAHHTIHNLDLCDNSQD